MSLRLMQLVELQHIAPAIHRHGRSRTPGRWHLGRCCYVRVLTSPYLALDIRDHFYPSARPDTLQPTRRGCRLRGAAVLKFLTTALNHVIGLWPDIAELAPCSDTHGDLDEEFECPNCNARLSGREKPKKK